MLFPSIFPIIFILLSTPCAVIVVWNVAATVLPPSWKRHFTHFLYFRSLLFRVIYIFKFQLNFEERERFSPTDYFLKPVLLTSSSGCQMALSSELSKYSPLDMAVTALTSPVSSPHLREGKGSRCSPWKGHYLRSFQGIPWVFWSQTMKHSGNGMMPSNGIFPRSQIYHRMDQTHYMTRGHVCTQRLNFALSHRTGTYLPLLQRDWCTPFTWRELSPRLQRFRPSCMVLSHSFVSEPQHLLSYIIPTHTVRSSDSKTPRVLSAHWGAGSVLPLLPEVEDQGLQQCWNQSIWLKWGPTIIRLEQYSPRWSSSGLQLDDTPPKSVSVDLPGLD